MDHLDKIRTIAETAAAQTVELGQTRSTMSAVKYRAAVLALVAATYRSLMAVQPLT